MFHNFVCAAWENVSCPSDKAIYFETFFYKRGIFMIVTGEFMLRSI